jgi:plastocyanin
VITISIVIALLVGAGVATAVAADSERPQQEQRTDRNAGASLRTVAARRPVLVRMRDIAFSPRVVRIGVGRKVRWVNQDDADHNVKSRAFASRSFRRGGTFTFKTRRRGTISYRCTIHPFMTGRLVVQSR